MSSRRLFRLSPDRTQRFSSQQRARTEALRALAVWQARQPGRRFTVVECKDDFVISRLSWSDRDALAATDLGASCEARGLTTGEAPIMAASPPGPRRPGEPGAIE